MNRLPGISTWFRKSILPGTRLARPPLRVHAGINGCTCKSSPALICSDLGCVVREEFILLPNDWNMLGTGWRSVAYFIFPGTFITTYAAPWKPNFNSSWLRGSLLGIRVTCWLSRKGYCKKCVPGLKKIRLRCMLSPRPPHFTLSPPTCRRISTFLVTIFFPRCLNASIKTQTTEDFYWLDCLLEHMSMSHI